MQPVPPRAGESTLRLRMPSPYRPRGRVGRRTTTAASSSTPSSRRTPRSRRRGSSRGRRGSSTSSSSASTRRRSRRRSASMPGRPARAGAASVGPGFRRERRLDPGLAEQRELDRRLGARVGLRPRPGGHGRAAPARSRIVMQVHYNLLQGRRPDRSRAVLRHGPGLGRAHAATHDASARPRRARLRERRRGRLCSRSEALHELGRKYRTTAAFVPAGLLILCRGSAGGTEAEPDLDLRPPDHRAHDDPRGGRAHASPRRGDQARAEPGHAPRPRAARHPAVGLPLAERVHTRDTGGGGAGRRRARHVPPRRPKRTHGEHGAPSAPRYVLWGEGTTDEMCLGILQVTRG